MKQSVLYVVLVIFLFSCSKQEKEYSIQSKINRVASKADSSESMYNAKVYNPGTEDIRCDSSESKDCVILDDITIKLKNDDGSLPEFVHPEIVNAYEEGKLKVDYRVNSQGNEYLIFMNQKGKVVAVYTNQQ